MMPTGVCNNISSQRLITRPFHLTGDKIGRAEKVGGDPVRRPEIELRRRADFQEHAFMHQADAIRQRQRFFLIVGHVDGRDAEGLLQRLQLEAHLLAQLGVEIAERLVQQQHLRLRDQRARQRDALLLPAAQIGRQPIRQTSQTQPIENQRRPAR